MTDELGWCLACCGDKFSIERSLREARAIGQCRDPDGMRDFCFYPVDQVGERLSGGDLRVQHLAKLRLITWPARVEHHELRDFIRNCPAGVLLDHCKRHIDSGRDSGGSPGFAAYDKKRVFIDR